MTSKSKPWWRHGLLWVILAPLVATVVAGIATIIMAAQSDPIQLVPGEFEKQGRGMAIGPAFIQRSTQVAEVVVATMAAGELRLEMPDSASIAAPQVMIVHPTLPSRDQSIALVGGPQHWHGELPDELHARSQVHVVSAAGDWRIVARLDDGLPLTFEPVRARR